MKSLGTSWSAREKHRSVEMLKTNKPCLKMKIKYQFKLWVATISTEPFPKHLPYILYILVQYIQSCTIMKAPTLWPQPPKSDPESSRDSPASRTARTDCNGREKITQTSPSSFCKQKRQVPSTNASGWIQGCLCKWRFRWFPSPCSPNSTTLTLSSHLGCMDTILDPA